MENNKKSLNSILNKYLHDEIVDNQIDLSSNELFNIESDTTDNINYESLINSMSILDNNQIINTGGTHFQPNMTVVKVEEKLNKKFKENILKCDDCKFNKLCLSNTCFKCNVCSSYFPTKNHFNYHNKKYHTNSKVPCKICNLKFININKMNRHLDKTHEKK